MRNVVHLSVLIGLRACVLCAAQTPSAESSHDQRPVLRVPVIEAQLTIDGRLDEPVWNDAVRTGPLQIIPGGFPQLGADASSTEVFLLRDEDHLLVAVRCSGQLVENGRDATDEPSTSTSSPAALPIRPGSFIRVLKGLPADQALEAVTLECWVRLRRLDAWQSLMGQHNYPVASGYALGTDNQGRIAFYLGDGGVYQPGGTLLGPVLEQDRWQHVVGTWDGKTKSLWIDGQLAAQQDFEGPVRPGIAPLWLGACGHNGPAVNHLQGDLAMPVIYSRALSADEMQARHRDQGRTPAAGDAVLACWPGETWRGNRVADQSPHGRHGHVVGSGTDLEFVDLLIDSNADRNSCYLIRLTPDDGGKAVCSYNEHTPPWHDRTWQPQFEFAVAWESDGWTAELVLPFEIFCKNKTLAPEIGFNVRRFRVPGQEIHRWHGSFEHPGDWGTLAGIPDRDSLPGPDYEIPKAASFSSAAQWGVNVYYVPGPERRSALTEQQGQQQITLGPGSAHPGNTGEVRLELESFLLAGDPHACGIIWDLAVDQQKGELYVLSDPRPVRDAPELRVFDRQGRYLRTVMPFSPALPRANVRDLCAMTVREGDTQLVVPKLFETLCGSLSLYGAYWHLPQKMSLAPDGDLILSNIYRGTLWRLKPDGSLPPEGWTSVYHAQRNEPFESHSWTQDVLNAQDVKNYLSFHSLHYPYFCFDPDGALYVSAGQSTRPTRNYGYHWEVGQQEVTYQRELSGTDGRDAYVWKYRLHGGVKLEEQDAMSGFASPSGLVHDGSHLIVADSGNNRLQVLGKDGRPLATIAHYEHQGQKHSIHGPTALAMDRDKHLYVLVASQPRSADQPVVERTLAALQAGLSARGAARRRALYAIDQTEELAGTESVGRFATPASGCIADRRRRRGLPAAGLGGERIGARAVATIGGRRSRDPGRIREAGREFAVSPAKRQPADPEHRPANRPPVRRRRIQLPAEAVRNSLPDRPDGQRAATMAAAVFQRPRSAGHVALVDVGLRPAFPVPGRAAVHRLDLRQGRPGVPVEIDEGRRGNRAFRPGRDTDAVRGHRNERLVRRSSDAGRILARCVSRRPCGPAWQDLLCRQGGCGCLGAPGERLQRGAPAGERVRRGRAAADPWLAPPGCRAGTSGG
jgi:hypothetical protein